MAVHRVVSCVEQSQQLFKRLRVALCKNTQFVKFRNQVVITLGTAV